MKLAQAHPQYRNSDLWQPKTCAVRAFLAISILHVKLQFLTTKEEHTFASDWTDSTFVFMQTPKQLSLGDTTQGPKEALHLAVVTEM